jgi:hypothetical protein
MRPQLNTALKLTATLVVVGISLAWLIGRASNLGHKGEQVWFYDESQKRLYPGNAGTFPPDKGIGGKRNDGVRATVIVFKGAKDDLHSRRIAYLQTCTSELKGALERARAARAAGKPFDTRLLARDSDFYQTNTLVRRPGDTVWHPSNTLEAQLLMSEWRSWHGPGGEPAVLSVPD